MDANAINAIVKAVQGPMMPQTDADFVLAPEGWQEIRPELDHPQPLVISTLSGVVAYVKANVDGHVLTDLLITVDAPSRVSLRGKIEGEVARFRRPLWIRAECQQTEGFGRYMDAETFTVWLQTGFEATAGRDQLLALVASIRENVVRETVDDGVAQEVKTGRGVTLVGMQRVPNPVLLLPFRTFHEVEQPASLFILRLRQAAGSGSDKPELALFEADGGAWKHEATHRIALYFQRELPEVRGIA